MTPPALTPGPAPTAAPRSDRLAVPRVGRWPPAVRSAELQRGTLVRCGPGVRPVGWPETPRVRLAALDPWLGEDHIAILRTAAWVWGAVRSPGSPLELSTAHRRRPAAAWPAEVRVHQYHYREGDTVRFGDFTATTELRTACDLLRLSEDFPRQLRAICRLLLLLGRTGRAQAAAALDRGPAPFRQRARQRLAEL